MLDGVVFQSVRLGRAGQRAGNEVSNSLGRHGLDVRDVVSNDVLATITTVDDRAEQESALGCIVDGLLQSNKGGINEAVQHIDARGDLSSCGGLSTWNV